MSLIQPFANETCVAHSPSLLFSNEKEFYLFASVGIIALKFFGSYLITKSKSWCKNRVTKDLTKQNKIPKPSLEVLLKRVETCPATAALYKEAQETCQIQFGHPIIFEEISARSFVPVNGNSSLNEAHCDLSAGTIRLSKEANEVNTIVSIVFELCNMAAYNDFQELNEKAIRTKKVLEEGKKTLSNAYIDFCILGICQEGLITQEDLAKGKEKIEFEKTISRVARMMHIAVKEHGWDPNVRIYDSWSELTFEQYWEIIKKSPHTNLYRTGGKPLVG